MSKLRLPKGATAAFRLERADEFGIDFTMHIYGTRGDGWYLYTSRWWPATAPPEPQHLYSAEWVELVNVVEKSGFWNMTEVEVIPEQHRHWTTEGGGWLNLSARTLDQYHRVHRSYVFSQDKMALEIVFQYCWRLVVKEE